MPIRMGYHKGYLRSKSISSGPVHWPRPSQRHWSHSSIVRYRWQKVSKPSKFWTTPNSYSLSTGYHETKYYTPSVSGMHLPTYTRIPTERLPLFIQVTAGRHRKYENPAQECFVMFLFNLKNFEPTPILQLVVHQLTFCKYLLLSTSSIWHAS